MERRMSTPLRAQDRLITAEEFAELPHDSMRPLELVRGVVCEMSPTNADHGLVQAQLVYLLRRWDAIRHAGLVRSETGHVLGRRPDTVRGPDVSFTRRERDGERVGPWMQGGPDLAVEVRSPSQRRGEIDEKVADYLAAGTSLVWVVEVSTRSVVIHQPGVAPRTLTRDDTLDGGDVLPGFSVPVREVFEDLGT
jgi:Uma2 family endonuclease